VDSNRNVKWEKGESPLTDIPVAARSNIHGALTITAQLTDANGETDMTASCTHFFDLLAFPHAGTRLQHRFLWKPNERLYSDLFLSNHNLELPTYISYPGKRGSGRQLRMNTSS